MKQRKPTRLKYYDYSNGGWYYVTICTKDHQHRFGSVINEKMLLNETGKAAEKMWLNIPAHYPFAELDEYIIMPNHIHGIIIIDYDINIAGNENIHFVGNENYHYVGDENIHPQHRTNLSNVIKGFKIGVTNWCKLNNHFDFKWQRSFYDRIIRNEKELFYIRKYIQQNPLSWDLEKNIENIEF